MAGGLAALLDDVAAIARLAAASTDDVAAASGRATVKATALVVDDTAVTPQYVRGIDPKRELPIVWRIARGSLVNKAILIVVLMVLASFVPWILTPLLMIGGTYLCFEGAEKIWELVRGGHSEEEEHPAAERGPEAEKKVVAGAVRTDFILSAEIMVISLDTIVGDTPGVLQRIMVLAVVAVLITALVYGAVGLLVKMDDIGMSLSRRDSEGAQRFGRTLVTAMPTVMTAISYIGMVAMLWVGGHIILAGLPDLGVPQPYDWVHHLEQAAQGLPGIGGLAGWLTNTFFSFVLGLVWGAVVLAVVHALPFGRGHGEKEESAS